MLIDDDAINSLTRQILGAAIEVHRILGPGLLESIYSACLQFELHTRGLKFLAQHTVPITYKGAMLDSVYRIDLVVEDRVVVEIKAVEATAPVHKAQVLSYLKIAKYPAGLLINFNCARLMDGVTRVVNTPTSVPPRLTVSPPPPGPDG